MSALARVTVLVVLVFGAFAGCSQAEPSLRPTVDEVLSRLPSEVDGTELGEIQVVDSNLGVGHAIDEALELLGRGREDGTIVFRLASQVDLVVGGIAVSGVASERVEAAVVQTWDAPAVLQRLNLEIDGRNVWVLEARENDRSLVYRSGPLVYIIAGKRTAPQLEALGLLP